MEERRLRWLAISDVHLGAGHVNPRDMYKRLRSVVMPYIKEGKVDLITIGGDYYDNALFLDNDAATYGLAFLHELFDHAQKHDIAIRIIRGTYTHDRDQLNSAARLAERFNIDFAYYTDVSTDFVKGYTFLYLPDNLAIPAVDIMYILPELLKDMGGKIDCIVGHGYCEHVLPPMLPANKHIEAWNADTLIQYLNHVAIFGHVHQPSEYKKKIYYTGSFDRLCHGEEEPKGCLYIELFGDGESIVTTVPNHEATPHITVSLTKETIEECVKEVKDIIEKRFPMPLTGYLRIEGDEKRGVVRSLIQKTYPDLIVTELDVNRKRKAFEKTTLDVCFTTYTGDEITRDNLPSLIFAFICNNFDEANVTEDEIKQGLVELQQEMKGGSLYGKGR